jgi:hypothetical protein
MALIAPSLLMGAVASKSRNNQEGPKWCAHALAKYNGKGWGTVLQSELWAGTSLSNGMLN